MSGGLTIGTMSSLPNPGNFFQCDNERGKLERLSSSRSRQRESDCKSTQISKIRKTAPGARSSLGSAVAREPASGPAAQEVPKRLTERRVAVHDQVLLLSVSKPSAWLVSSSEIVFIHDSFGLVVQPAKLTRRVFSSMTQSK